MIYATLMVTLLVAILVAFSFLYQDQIVARFTKELNKSLKTPILVSHMEFSLLKNFPYGTVQLNNVVALEPASFATTPDTLLQLSAISFHFDMIQLWNENFELQNISAVNGYARLRVNKQGVANYDIIETSAADTTDYLFSLQKVNFDGVEFLYHDQTTAHKFHFQLAHIIAKGTFSQDQINFALYGQTQVRELIIDKTAYVNGEAANIDVGVEIDLIKNTFQVSRGFVTLRSDMKFDVKGTNTEKGYHFVFKGHQLDLHKIRQLIPRKYQLLDPKYGIAGDADITVLLENEKRQTPPKIVLDFDLKNGRLKNTENGQTIGVKELQGNLDMGRQASPVSATLDISQIQLQVNEGTINGSLTIKNLKQPTYALKLAGAADLKKISEVFEFENFEMKGLANFRISAKGGLSRLDSILNSDIQKVHGQANIALTNAEFIVGDLPLIQVDSGTLLVNEQKAKLSGLVGQVDGATCSGWVWVDNWLNYSINQTQDLRIAGNVTASHLYIDHWISDSSVNNASDFSLPSHIYIDATGQVGDLQFAENRFTDVRAQVAMSPQKLKFTKVSARTFDGLVTGNLVMNVYAHFVGVESNCEVTAVNVKEILQAYNDFGQRVITQKHLDGDLSFLGTVRFKMDKKMVIDESSIYVDGDVLLLNGVIHENKLLTDIPKEIESNKILALFINLSEFEKRLHNIRFDTIQNHLTIQNEVLTIPNMNIRSSAMGISLNGTHTFTNDLDYYVTFNLNEVLSKRKLETDEYGFIEDDQLGRRLVYLHIYNKKDEIKVDVDKFGKLHRSKASAIGKEFNQAKGVLKKELGLFKSDTTIHAVEEPEPTFEYEVDFGEFDTINTPANNAPAKSSTPAASSASKKKTPEKKKKNKKEQKKEFEEWEFEDDDY